MQVYDATPGISYAPPLRERAVHCRDRRSCGRQRGLRLFIPFRPGSIQSLAYSTNTPVYAPGLAIAPNIPSSSGGTVVAYSVAPSLRGAPSHPSHHSHERSWLCGHHGTTSYSYSLHLFRFRVGRGAGRGRVCGLAVPGQATELIRLELSLSQPAPPDHDLRLSRANQPTQH